MYRTTIASHSRRFVFWFLGWGKSKIAADSFHGRPDPDHTSWLDSIRIRIQPIFNYLSLLEFYNFNPWRSSICKEIRSRETYCFALFCQKSTFMSSIWHWYLFYVSKWIFVLNKICEAWRFESGTFCILHVLKPGRFESWIFWTLGVPVFFFNLDVLLVYNNGHGICWKESLLPL